MKTNSKRFLFLILTLVMALTFATSVFASDEVTNPVVVSDTNMESNIIPLADQWTIGMHTGSSSTLETTRNFTIGSAIRSAKLSLSVTVNSPCTLYLFIYDGNGKALGTKSFTITRAGTFTFTPSPSSLGGGNYSYGYMFDKSGVSYTFLLTATL